MFSLFFNLKNNSLLADAQFYYSLVYLQEALIGSYKTLLSFSLNYNIYSKTLGKLYFIFQIQLSWHKIHNI